jgi:hypothetical protein
MVGDAAVAAILAALDLAAERGRAALLDRRHDLELTQAHMSGIGPAPVGRGLALRTKSAILAVDKGYRRRVPEAPSCVKPVCSRRFSGSQGTWWLK